MSLSLSHARVCLFRRKKARHDLASALSSLSLSLLLQRQQRQQRKCKSKMTMVPKSLSATTNKRTIDLCTLFLGVTKTKQNKGGGREGGREGKRGWVGGALGFFFFFFWGFFFSLCPYLSFFFCWEGRGFFFFSFFFFPKTLEALIYVLWTFSDTVCFCSVYLPCTIQWLTNHGEHSPFFFFLFFFSKFNPP